MKQGVVLGGRYQITAPLSRGGMAETWVARDLEDNRAVVVKSPLRALLAADEINLYPHQKTRETRSGPEACRGRFRREARLLGSLNHPGIPKIYTEGHYDERPYLVMEYINGETLADFTATHQPLPLAATAAIATQLAEALQAAHNLPVVHRDLNPRNILIATSGRVVLIDFGIARPLGTAATRYTSPGMPPGSQGYMAPEQIMDGPISRQTDLYALGCVLHYLLVGRPPFVERNGVSLAQQHIQEQPLPLESYGINVPYPLGQLVLALLAKDPLHRPDNAAMVVEAFTPYLPQPGSAPPRPALTPDPTLGYRCPESPSHMDDARAADVRRTAAASAQPRTPARRRVRGAANRSQIEQQLNAIRARIPDAPEAALAELDRLLTSATAAFGRPHVVIAHIELHRADCNKIIGNDELAAAQYTTVLTSLEALAHQSAQARFLGACAQAGLGECQATLGDLAAGTESWLASGRHIASATRAESTDASGLSPQQLDELKQRHYDLRLQLAELGADPTVPQDSSPS